FLMRQTIIVVSRLIEYDLKNTVFDHYQRLDRAFYTRNSTAPIGERKLTLHGCELRGPRPEGHLILPRTQRCSKLTDLSTRPNGSCAGTLRHRLSVDPTISELDRTKRLRRANGDQAWPRSFPL
ncbi:MAG: hypothetical protein ACK6A5_15920, partial [Flavobacteriales bacterium]